MNDKRSVFIIQHTIDEYDSEPKLLGVYETQSDAEAAVARFRLREGFRKYQDGFHVDEYELNKDYWETGFAEE